MYFTKKNDSFKMSSAFLERLKMASYCSMTSLEKISSNPFRRKMCNSESVPEVYSRNYEASHGHEEIIGGGDCNKDLTQCYSVTTGRVSTLVRSPSFSSLSSIEVAEINNSNGFSSNAPNAHPSVKYRDFSSHHVTSHAPSKYSSRDVNYLNIPSCLPPIHRSKIEKYSGPRITSPVIKRSRVVRTQHHDLCIHGITR